MKPAAPNPITRRELCREMVRALTAAGWPRAAITGYVAAQLSHGVLRRGVPQWQMRAAAVVYYLPGDWPATLERAGWAITAAADECRGRQS